MAMQWVGRIGSGDEQLDRDLRDLDIVTGPAGSFLYASTGQDGGVTAYRLQGDGGAARLVDSAHYTVWGMGVGAFDRLDLDGRQQLVLSGTGDGKLIRYRLEDDGTLAKSGKIDLPGETTQNHAALTGLSLGADRTVVYTVESESGTLAGWRSTGTGGLDSALPATGIDFDPTAPVLLETTSVGGRSYLLAADSGVQGLRSFRVDTGTGALRAADSMGPADGLGMALPTAMETVTAHGKTWVVLAAAGSNSLSVMELTATGGLRPTDHILDTRATRFDGVTALEVVRVGDHVFVLAGGADDGLSLFTLLPDGHLVHRQTLVQETGLGLENVTGLTATRIGEALQIFVTSGREAGITQFSLSLADLGAVIEAGDAPPAGGAAALSGTEDSDLLIGRDMQTTLLGRAGDDILVAGSAGGVLTGGAGADLFVLRSTDRPLRITDFQAGIDQLDLSRFPMLRSADQLTLTPTDTGITVGFGTTLIEITSAAGTPLGFADLWPAGFMTPDRVGLPETDPDPRGGATRGADVLEGGAGDDRIAGRAGDDRLLGKAGNDRLKGGLGDDWLAGMDGDDRMSGGRGQDQLYGGTGADRLDGRGGADRLFGGFGEDQLFGGAGADWLAGMDGNDRLTGGAGHDGMSGGAGDDWLAGHDGDDRMFGDDGQDQLYGGVGQDWMAGQGGADRMFGGAGQDQLYGGVGDDWLAGLEGADRLFGGSGRDQLFGGTGADWLAGMDGNDRLSGEAGHDRMSGGAGDDWLAGHDGNDSMSGDGGHDQLYGGLGDDWLAGNDGNDRLFGGVGQDQLYGGLGDDILAGLDGADRLFGGAGDDRLTGGTGADHFVFAAAHGQDTITDFTVGEDLIRLAIPGLTFGDLAFTAEGGDLRLLTGEGSLVLTGFAPGDLGAADFVFL